MAEYIPFITSPTALTLVKNIYPDAEIARVSVEWADRISIPSPMRLWIDPAVDGFDDLDSRRTRRDSKNPDIERKNRWYQRMKAIPGYERIGDPAFLTKPVPKITKAFVSALLDICREREPAWLTVPQLPIIDGGSRNKINRMLAQATAEWKGSRNFTGKLILPLVFTNQRQINRKTERNPKVAQAERCYHEARADGFWVVDASLTDDSGSRTLRNTRIPALIELHKELNNAISSRIRIGGPYWGTNLVLWARGLTDYAAIGVGSTFQYHLSGGPGSTPATRIAIGALRRRVNIAQLKPWLEKSLKRIGSAHSEHSRLERIYKRLPYLADPEIAREQVALFYADWLQVLTQATPAGRALALFQDLATAFAFGRTLDDFPSEGTARRPESVVEPLMLNCL